MQRPGVGIGVIIQNEQGKVLIGKRKGNHSPFFSIPGGHLENGETFEEAAYKEVFEETSLKIISPQVICVTNNLRTFRNEGRHYVSINLFVNQYQGTPIVKEPDKCEFWNWYDPDKLPTPHFDASEYAIKCYKEGAFYLKNP